MAYRDVILSKTIEYVRTKKLSSASRGAIVMVDCPYCKFAKSAQIIPALAHIKCVHCGKMFTLVDLIRFTENKINDTEESILNYVKEFLKIDVQTTQDAENLEKLFETYLAKKWALVPCAKKGKAPIQSEWQKKENRNSSEWFAWTSSGLNLGVRTGSVSNITVIDFDLLTRQEKAELVKEDTKQARKNEILAKKVIPEEIKKIMGNTLMQETHGGFQAFYIYNSELPKTAINDGNIHLDLENDGGQVVIPPSYQVAVEEEYEENEQKKKRIVGYGTRKWINDSPIIAIPLEFLEWLKTRTKEYKKTAVDESGIDLSIKESLQVSDDFKVKDLQNNRNNTLMSLGGLFRKELNAKQTGYVLNVLNKHLLTDPLPSEEVSHILNSLNKYIDYDETELAKDVLEYLKDTDTASKLEIEFAIFGQKATSENKKKLDKTLSELIKDEKIIKKNTRDYKLIKNMEWDDNILNVGTPVNFKVPYFNDYAYFNWGDLALIGAVTKFGKCFRKNTKILMADGNIKNIQDIKKGEYVQGVNNQKRLVKSTTTGIDKMYTIYPVNNTPFTVNGEHILCLVHTATNEKIEISVNDYLKQSKGFKHCYKLYRDTVDWKKKEITIEPYFLGLWLGDGHSACSRVTTADNIIVKYLKEYAKKLKCFLSHTKYKNNCSSYTIGDKSIPWQKKNSIQQRLREYNLLNNKHIPFDYKINDRETRLQMLAGIIDSDGYLSNQGNYQISFVNETLANDVAFVARSLGFSAKVTKYKAAFNTIRYRFNIVGDTTIIPTKLKRKQSHKKQVKKNPLYSGFKIKTEGIETYYGFMLDGDSLFLLDNFIVSHNSTLAMNIVKRLVDQGIKPYYVYNESGGRFGKNALALGLKDGDFYRCRCGNPYELIIKPNSVVIYDWIKPKDFAKTDEMFEVIIDKLERSNSFMIGFTQLRGESKSHGKNAWFAEDLIRQFVAISAKYLYDDKDGLNTYFELGDIRDSKTHGKVFKVPCRYDRETREVKMQEEIEREIQIPSEQEKKNDTI